MIAVSNIKAVVAAYFGVSVLDMESNRRDRYIARPRQLAIYFCRVMTKRSLPEIGRAFGHRDHTTVMHACDKVTHLRKNDGAFAVTALELELQLKQLDSENSGPLEGLAYETVVDRVCDDLRRILLTTRPKYPGQILGPIAAAFANEEGTK